MFHKCASVYYNYGSQLYRLPLVMRPESGFRSHQRNSFRCWFVILYALSASFPERKSHIALPDEQQGPVNVGAFFADNVSTLEYLSESRMAGRTCGSHICSLCVIIFLVLLVTLLDMFMFMHLLSTTCKVSWALFSITKHMGRNSKKT